MLPQFTFFRLGLLIPVGFAQSGNQNYTGNAANTFSGIEGRIQCGGGVWTSAGVRFVKDNGTSGDKHSRCELYSNNGYSSEIGLIVQPDGQVTKPLQFHIEVQRTNDQTGYVANANFGTPMIFNDVVRTRGTTNSALNTSTGKITVPVDGVYYLEGSVFTSTGNYLSQAWFTEGTSRMTYSDWTEHQDTNQVQASGMHYLSANTEVGFHPYGTTSTSLTLGDSIYHTWFRVTLIG